MSHKNKQKACKQPDISDPHAAHRPNCHHGHAEEIRPESAEQSALRTDARCVGTFDLCG
ncbi:MAG: hypothetical protein RSF70_00585 [Ruthenibacterium sp.]